MISNRLVWCLALCGLAGCSAGSESAARSFFDAEFKQWMVGQPSAFSGQETYAPGAPIGYVIQSVAADQPDFLAKAPSQELPDNWKTWPAYRFNISLKSKVGLDSHKESVSIYTVTWNAGEKKWYLKKRFL